MSDGEVGVNGADVTLTTGGLTAKVVKGAPWNLTFIGGDGKVLTESAGKSLGRFKARCRIERHRPAGQRIRCDHGRFRP